MQEREQQIVPPHILKELERLKSEDQLRVLRQIKEGTIDFSSNDYLGLRAGYNLPSDLPNNNSGAGGSRLLTGNHAQHEELESFAADYFRAPAALLFNSAYHANLGLLSSLAGRHDTYLYDERVHASIKDGMRLSLAKKWSFPHQNWSELERLLKNCKGTAYIVVEGLYSMDGDHPDLPLLVELAERYGAWLIVDEAHSTGLYGPEGAGLACHFQLQDRILARVHAFGKAAGWYGAIVTGSPELKQYLINKARTFIYTTALPPDSISSLRQRLQLLRNADSERKKLDDNCFLIRKLVDQYSPTDLYSPILPVVIPGNTEVKEMASKLQAANYVVRPILAPTVPAGAERLRIILHSYNTETELYAFSANLMALKAQLKG